MGQFDESGRLQKVRSKLDEPTLRGMDYVVGSDQYPFYPLLALLQTSRPKYTPITAPHFNLWCREAINRAHNLLNLFILVETDTWHRVGPSIRSCLDQALASTLLDLYQSIDIDDTRKLLPCTPLIRGIASGLVELFGGATKDLKTNIDLSPISLNSLKRRALALIVSEVVIGLISETFPYRKGGTIIVLLESRGIEVACLTVHGEGVVLTKNRLENSLCLINQLASILDGEVVFRNSRFGGVRLEVEFSTGT